MGRLSGEPTVEAVAVQGGLLWTASRGSGVPFVLAHGGPGLSDNLAPEAEMVEDVARATQPVRYPARPGQT